MATLRPSMRRFNLESVAVDGSPNGYKNPQLVLKTQVNPAPRVPYTGSQTRMPVRRHLLMVHVKDKADELERLNLDAFASSTPEIDPALRYSVTCLPSDLSLIFLFPKATSKNRHTLEIKFKELVDFMAVCADLRALNITMDNGLRSHDAGFAPGQGRASFPMAPPSNKFIARSLSNPRNFYSNSPPPGLSSTPQNMYTSNAANFPHQMVPERPLSQPMDSPGNSISRRPSWSPGLQPPRPATAIGIPGVLGEGIYKLSRIGSTTRKRRVNKSWRIPSLGSPGFYTVPKHFDRTLGKEDIVMSLGSPLFRDDGPPRPRSQNAIPSLTRDDSRPSEEYEYLRSDYDPIRGQAGELLGPSMRNASMLETASQPTGQKTETPGHVQPTRVSDGLLSSEPSSQHSTDTSWGSRTSHLHPRPTFFDGVAGKHHRVASSQQRVAASTTSQSCGNTFATQPGQILPQNYDTSGMDDALLRVVEINQEGLSKATKLWNDLMERGQKATEAIESSDEAYNIFLKYGEEWAKKLDDIAASTAQKMRKARHRKEA